MFYEKQSAALNSSVLLLKTTIKKRQSLGALASDPA